MNVVIPVAARSRHQCCNHWLPYQCYYDQSNCKFHLKMGRVHMKTLMACMELGRTLSRKVNPDAFLFKATKASETTK
jgi:hypothetical protein